MLTSAKIVGLNSDQAAAQVLIDHKLSSVSLGDNSPEISLFIVVACRSDDAFIRTRQALGEAEDVFYASDKQLSEKVEVVFQSIKESLKDCKNLELLTSVTFKEGQSSRVMYLYSHGQSISAYLLRGEQRVNLCQMGEADKLISGFLKPGDRLILTTNSLFEIYGSDLGLLQSIPIDEVEEEITAKLPHDQINPLAAIFIEEKLEAEQKMGEARPIKEISSSDETSHFKIKTLNISFLKNIPIYILKVIPFIKKSKKMVGVGILLLVLLLIGYKFIFNKGQEATVGEVKTENINQADKQPEAEVEGLISVDDLPLWLDLNLIKEGVKVGEISLSGEEILMLDHTQTTLLKVSTKTKASQILAGEDKLGKVSLISLNGGVGWVYSDERGLMKMDTNSVQIDNPIKKDSEWGSIKSISAFAGNIYLLDETKNQIWKYIAVTDGFSEKRSYLNEGVEANFSQSQKMLIDGSIWILKIGGEILKFTQGRGDHFAPNGLDKPLKNPQNFFVSDETENIYILDKENSRVVVLDKLGAYKSQYQSSKLTQIDDLVVDEVGKRSYLLGDNKIYSLELK